MPASWNQQSHYRRGYIPLSLGGQAGPTQAPSDYIHDSARAQGPHLRVGSTALLTYPQSAPHHEAQRLAYTPKPHYSYDLPEQGSSYSAYPEPARLQRPTPLLNSSDLPQQAPNSLYYSSHAPYQPLRSGMSAYMPQQGSAESSSTTQRWFGIPAGGVDLRQSIPSRESVPSMGNAITSEEITVQFPDGTTKVIRAHGGVVTLGMAAKAVQGWYRESSGRSGYLLKGFSVVNGVYVAYIV